MRSGGEVGRRGGGRDGRCCCRPSVIGRSFGSLLPIDRNSSYRKLSLDLYKISILKLDGTSFGNFFHFSFILGLLLLFIRFCFWCPTRNLFRSKPQ